MIVRAGADRRLPVQFFRVWVVLWVVAAGLTTRTPYQRVMLAGGLAGSHGCRRGDIPSVRNAAEIATAAVSAEADRGYFLVPMLSVAISYAGRFAVVPDIDDRSSFLAGMAGFLAGAAVAYPVIWLYRCRRLDRRNAPDLRNYEQSLFGASHCAFFPRGPRRPPGPPSRTARRSAPTGPDPRP